MIFCPVCSGPTQRKTVFVPINLIEIIPRQVEPFIKITHWQCLQFREHVGELSEPSNSAGF